MRAMAYDAAPDLRAIVTMEGDAWEMEDHRNWFDASLKTYVRPLRLPSPYVLAAGSVHAQSVTLTLEATPRRRPARLDTVAMLVGPATGAWMPRIGLRLGDDATLADAVAARACTCPMKAAGGPSVVSQAALGPCGVKAVGIPARGSGCARASSPPTGRPSARPSHPSSNKTYHTIILDDVLTAS